jgi:hypothetical protein
MDANIANIPGHAIINSLVGRSFREGTNIVTAGIYKNLNQDELSTFLTIRLSFHITRSFFCETS